MTVTTEELNTHFFTPMRAFFGDPPGDDPAKVMAMYGKALQSFSAPVLARAAEHLQVSATRRTWPLPADCIGAARKMAIRVDAENRGSSSAASRGLFSYHMPYSLRLQCDVTKSEAMQMVYNGVHPAGSIWLPGPRGKAHIGDLFEPDPKWERPLPAREWSREEGRGTQPPRGDEKHEIDSPTLPCRIGAGAEDDTRLL